MKILILANSRFKGGLSGSDAIYENFVKYFPCETSVDDCISIDYNPFFLCYLHRVIISIKRALFDIRHFDVVYSSSDFLPDALAGFIYKIRGRKWVAGFYLEAFRSNRIHFCTQKFVSALISRFADMIIVTNPTMYRLFPTKQKTWINGGIDLSLAGISDKPKIYDAVFCGRIHPSKGIDELIEIWDWLIKNKPNAKLAVIGDGDLGKEYIRKKWGERYGIDLLGYMGDERYEIYKQSKIVLYPTPLKYDHFSIAPVEAMACGCMLIHFNTPVVKFMLNCAIIDPISMDRFKTNLGEALTFKDELLNIELSSNNMGYAKFFDYKTQVLRVWDDIRKVLNENTDNRF